MAEALSRMMEAACLKGLFHPWKTGNEGVMVTHLQYADDTIFFGEARAENIVTLKSVLRCFEWFSGLKINFGKSSLMGDWCGAGVFSELGRYFTL